MQYGDRLSRDQVPDTYRLVTAARRQQRVLVVDVQVADLLIVSSQRCHEPAISGAPDFDQIVIGACEYVPARAIEQNTIDGGQVTKDALVDVDAAEELGLHHIQRIESTVHLALVKIEHQIHVAIQAPLVQAVGAA